MIKVPIFKLEFEKSFVEKFKKGSEEILTSGRPIGENKYARQFEEKFSKLIGAKYCIATTNGTSAIELALRCLDVKGTTVLLPSNTFSATAIAALNAGADFGLVDIEENSFSLSPEDLEREIERRLSQKEKIGAVIIVHIAGIISSDIKKIKSICNKYDIPLVEDAAHAQCSQYKGLRAGTIGKIGCFSFFPTKVMTTGEGGMFVTNDKKIYELARSLKDFGRNPDDIDVIMNNGGNNLKISEFTGLMGSLECDRVLGRIAKRNKLVNVYVRRLKGSGYTPVLQDDGVCSYYKMILRTNIDREWLRKYCKEHGITLTGEVYKIPIHRQPAFKEKFKKEKLPITDMICDNHICPPLYPELTVKEINYICDVLLRAEEEYEK